MKELLIAHSELNVLSPLAKKWVINPEYFSDWNIPTQLEDCSTLIKKKIAFDWNEKRKSLVECLLKDYSFLNPEDFKDAKVIAHIQSLLEPTTYTVTTGQQLHIFLGPMYVPHKIMSAIAYAEKLQSQNPDFKIIPVFWLASEDHDFEEIAEVNLYGKTFKWEQTPGGATGEMPTTGIVQVCEQIRETLNLSESEKSVFQIFEKHYRESATLSEATIKIVHAFFGEHGVICLDANKPELKKFFQEIIKEEFTSGKGYKALEEHSKWMQSKGLPNQIVPRDTPLFLLQPASRERIERKADSEFVLRPSGEIKDKANLIEMADSNPAYFSPNVAFRPLYQETILPNLAYVGGAAEVEYWLQFVKLFEIYGIDFPLIIMRKVQVYIGEKWVKSWEDMGLEPKELFLNQTLFEKRVKALLLTSQKEEAIMSTFESWIQEIADWTYELSPADVKSIKSKAKTWKKELKEHFHNLELRVSQSNEQKIKKINKIHEMMYPKGVFQERTLGFLEFVLKGGSFVDNYVSKYADNQGLNLRM